MAGTGGIIAGAPSGPSGPTGKLPTRETAAAAVHLLTLLADPTRATTMMAELQQRIDAANEAKERADAAVNDVQSRERTVIERTKALDDRDAEVVDLDTLRREAAAAQTALAAARAEFDQYQKNKTAADAQAIMQSAKLLHEERTAFLDEQASATETQLATVAAEREKAEAAAKQRSASLDVRDAEIKKRETAAANREASVLAREQAADQKAAEAQATIDDHNAKVERLKQAMGNG